MAEHIPAKVWPVGRFIADELEARGWSTLDLAKRMGGDLVHTVAMVDLLIHVPDTRLRMGDIADPMARALGVSPRFLRNLEATYVASRSPVSPNTGGGE